MGQILARPTSVRKALILVDIQNDFLPPSGALAVGEGRDILPTVHRLLDEYEWDLIVASMDYHPPGHVSFASTWEKEPFTSIMVPVINKKDHIEQALWPDHCVQGSEGGEIEASIQLSLRKLQAETPVEIIRKGANTKVDSYSAFADNVYSGFTQLCKILHSNTIEKVVVVGLATDFCVRATAIDARKFGFETVVIKEGIRGVFPANDQKVYDELAQWGVQVKSFKDFSE